jgi:uncharacterized protein YkwD
MKSKLLNALTRGKTRTGRGYMSMSIDDGISHRTHKTDTSDSSDSSPQRTVRQQSPITKQKPAKNMRETQMETTSRNEQKTRPSLLQGKENRNETPKLMKEQRRRSSHTETRHNEVRPPLREQQRQNKMSSKAGESRRSNSLFVEPKKQLSVPGNWYYSSNHILINQERERKQITPLVRSAELDEEARKQAEQMAKKAMLLYTKQSRLAERLTVPFRHFAENVASGKSIRSVHTKFMQESRLEKANLLNPVFKSMGVGTAKGPADELYICQIFVA